MKADQINRFALVALLGITVFLLLDSYVLPMNMVKGVLVTKTGQESSMLHIAIVQKPKQTTLLTVPAETYNHISVNDTIEVGRSFITHRIMKIAVLGKGRAYRWNIGFVFLGGANFLIFLVVSIAAYLFFFYNMVKRAESRREITVYLGFLCGMFIVFYFLFQ